MTYDLLILGGGPAGYHAAQQAAARGLKCVLFEERALGGVCLNEGCIPSKTLLHSAKLYEICAGGAAKYGVESKGAVLNHAAALARKNKLVRQLTAAVAALLRNAGAETVSARAAVEGRSGDGLLLVSAGGKLYEGRNLLIATGSRAALPSIPGLAEAAASGFALTNREILSLGERPGRLLILGGGVIGLEMAAYFRAAGTETTVVEALPQIANGLDPELAALLRRDMEKRGIRFLTNAKCVAVSQGGIDVELSAGTREALAGDKLLVAVGRRLNADGIGLETIGLNPDARGAIPTDDRMRTAVEGVYAAGDVDGTSMLAHTAFREAEVAVANIAGEDARMSYAAVPSVIYTHPEAASVGETLASATDKGISAREIKLSMRHSGRYLVENEGGAGVMKLVLGPDDVILGAALVGDPASEIIATMAVAVQRRMTCGELTEAIFPHPSVSEIFRDAALAAMRS